MRFVPKSDIAGLVSGLPERVRKGYQQWLETALLCMPSALARYTVASRPVLVLRPLGDKAELTLETPVGREAVGTVSFGELKSGGLRSILAPLAFRAIRVEVPEEQMLYRTVRLPAQVAKGLRQVVRYEIDRLTPFSSTDVYYDAAVTGLSNRGPRLDVKIALCHGRDLDPWLSGLTAADARPVNRITSLDAWPGANLLPPEQRPRQSPWRLTAQIVVSSLPVLLVGATLLTPLWQTATYERQLGTEVARLRTLLERESQLEDELAALRQENAALLEARRNQPRVADVLKTLTDAMPDSSYLIGLNYNDRGMELRGEAANAADLLGMFERNTRFRDATFRSPVTTMAAEKKERFHIHLGIEAETAP
jgi:general secretion pathway protein L